VARTDRRRPLVPGQGPLARIPPLLGFVGAAAVFATGALVGGAAGAAVLGVLALALAGLLGLTWPRLAAGDRAVRLVSVLALVAVALLVWRH
jgi:hypothetical protein